jgi:hypothetical protein
MKWLGKPYYIGLLSAAALHGSSHQQPMESLIITRPPALRKISTGKITINFHVKNYWNESDIFQQKLKPVILTFLPRNSLLLICFYSIIGWSLTGQLRLSANLLMK